MFRQAGTYKIKTKPDINASCARDNLVGRFQATKVVDKEWQVLKEKKVGLNLWNHETIPPDSSPTL